MSPVDQESTNEKFQKLNEVIEHLEEYRKVPRADFMIDHTVNSAAMYHLVLGIEIITDIGNHILNELFQTHPKDYAEIIAMLGEYGVIPEQLAKENATMPKFRNLLIHEYVHIDLRLVYDNLQKAPHTFREFASAFSDFLEKTDESGK